MHAAYFVDEREVTCRMVETKGPTAVATLLFPKNRPARTSGEAIPLFLGFGTGLEVPDFRGEC
jgi:hypothetical protein